MKISTFTVEYSHLGDPDRYWVLLDGYPVWEDTAPSCHGKPEQTLERFANRLAEVLS